MGMPTKKAHHHEDNHQGKPRIGSVTAFICAQPFDTPAHEVIRAARSAGYEVELANSIHRARNKYKHLRFYKGDAPTAFVTEFIANTPNARAKAFTIANNTIVVSGEKSGGLDASSISAIVDTVLRRGEDEEPVKRNDTADFWLPSVSKKTSGPKPRKKVPQREKLHEQRQPPVAPEPEPMPAPEMTPLAVSPEPQNHEHPSADAQLEAEDVSLQQLRDSFMIGDDVHVTQRSANGSTYTRAGRIKDKESSFATVKLGSVVEKIPYKRLSLAPRIAGRGTSNSNGDTADSNGLRVVPESFKQLKTIPAPATPEVASPKPPSEKPAAPVSEPTPAIAVGSPAAHTPVAGTPEATTPLTSTSSSDLAQQAKDVFAWVEMGATFDNILPAIAAATRIEISQKREQAIRLTQEADAQEKQLNAIESYLQFRTLTQEGPKK